MKRSRAVALFLTFFAATQIWPFQCRSEEFEDALGRNIILKSAPERIIPLAPSLTEILYFLGLGDRVAGATRFSSYPPEAAHLPKVGSYVNLNVEKILSLNPDLVIGTVDGNRPGVVELLEQAGIPVFLVNPRSVAEAVRTVETVGRVCGIPEKGTRLFHGLQERMDRVFKTIRDLRRPVVFLQINTRPLMSVNRNTFHHDLIRLAGGISMTGDEPLNYPRVSIEEVLARKPEVIIISSMERGGEFQEARQYWLNWKSIPAVKNGRIHLIDSDLIDRPSPRIVQGLETLAGIIHPEVKWQ